MQRIEIRDGHRVADQRSSGRSAPGPDGNPPLLRESDEIPDDQKIARVLHLLDGANFAIQALDVFGKRVLQLALRGQSLQAHAPRFKSLACHVFEVAVDGVLGRNVELRKRLLHRVELQLASLGDVPGPVESVFHFAEQRHHFFAPFQVEYGILEAHAIRIRHGFAGLDA